MCGISAVFGEIGPQAHNVFETMLTMNILRGVDSVGVAAFGTETPIIKDTVMPLELLKSTNYKKMVLGNKNYCLMGHNRSATRGTVTRANAHPFRHQHITLVHNGTLITRVDTGKHKPDTDSEGICIAIAERGIEKVWEELDGDATLVYYNSKDNSLNLISNGKRPLVFAYSKDLKTAFVASEQFYIRRPVDFEKIKLQKDTIYKPDDNDLWSLKIDPKTKQLVETSTALTPKKTTYGTAYHGGRQDSWKNETWEYDPVTKGYKDQSKDKSVLPFTSGKGQSGGINSIKNVAFLQNKRAPSVSESEFIEKYKECHGCGEKLEYKASTVISHDVAYCDGCVMVAEANFINVNALVGA